MDSRLDILGVRFAPMTKAEIHDHIVDCVRQRKRSLVLSLNAQALNLASSHPWLRAYFNQADAMIVDGYGVVLAAWVLGKPLPQRFTYAEWIWELTALCEQQAMSLYFLGARAGVALEAARRLSSRHPALKVVGTRDGYFDRRHHSAENRAVVQEINRADPDLLILGLGMPLQEQWLLENWTDLNARVALTGGGVFNYVSGRLPRPPAFLADHGFEWLGRLILEPRRLWRRYLIGNPLFLWRVFKQRLRSKDG
jgi:N-acetylglucosaminyldiphosphoundecaprenol N-acetyl-beta-D-mannosaminyltransferase